MSFYVHQFNTHLQEFRQRLLKQTDENTTLHKQFYALAMSSTKAREVSAQEVIWILCGFPLVKFSREVIDVVVSPLATRNRQSPTLYEAICHVSQLLQTLWTLQHIQCFSSFQNPSKHVYMWAPPHLEFYAIKVIHYVTQRFRFAVQNMLEKRHKTKVEQLCGIIRVFIQYFSANVAW